MIRAPCAARASASLLVAVVLAGAAAAPAGGARSAPEVLAAHCRAREALSSLRTRFEQARVFTALGEEERSSGVFYYRRPDAFRWEYREPDGSFTVVNGRRGWVVFPTIRQVRRIELGAGRLEGLLATVGFGPCGPGFDASFEAALVPGGGDAPVLSLRPLRPEISAMFTSVELTLDPRDHLPRRVVLTESGGDRVRLDFLDVRRDGRLEASLFQFAPPEDYDVMN